MRGLRLIFPIIFLPLITSFCFFKSKRTHEDMANDISIRVAKDLCKRHDMDWIGDSGGMMGSVQMIGLLFQIHHPLNRIEARERIIDCVEALLKAVNENKEIRPYLKDYPFTTKNVHVSIFSNYSDGREVYDPYISVVSVYESDQIVLSTSEPNNKNSFKNRYRESYSEALAQLRGKTQSYPKPITKSITKTSMDPCMKVN